MRPPCAARPRGPTWRGAAPPGAAQACGAWATATPTTSKAGVDQQLMVVAGERAPGAREREDHTGQRCQGTDRRGHRLHLHSLEVKLYWFSSWANAALTICYKRREPRVDSTDHTQIIWRRVVSKIGPKLGMLATRSATIWRCWSVR
jgi:hypothetical protein